MSARIVRGDQSGPHEGCNPSPRDSAAVSELCRRWHAAPETLENRTLMGIARAIEERRGDFDDADIWALGQKALGLLDALIERRISS